MDAVERAAKERRLAMTKQISRDDVERVCDDYPWVNYADRRKALNMLRSLMDRVEELEANVTGAMNELHRRAGERQRLLFLRNKSLEAQLAAANERLEDTERKLAALRRQWQT